MREPGLVRSRTNRPRAAPNQTKRRRADPPSPSVPKNPNEPARGPNELISWRLSRTNPSGARPNEPERDEIPTFHTIVLVGGGVLDW
jgi:hypothetical protein